METDALARDRVGVLLGMSGSLLIDIISTMYTQLLHDWRLTKGKFNSKSVVFSSIVSSFLRTTDMICSSPQQIEHVPRNASILSDKSRAEKWTLLSAADTSSARIALLLLRLRISAMYDDFSNPDIIRSARSMSVDFSSASSFAGRAL